MNEVLNPVTVLELLAIETVPPSVRDVSNTKSAVNLLPAVDWFMNTDFTSSKFLTDCELRVNAEPPVSNNWLALLLVACAEEIRFSPVLKLPVVVIKLIVLPLALWINPVAPDVAPVIFAPAGVALWPLVGVPLTVSTVNIRISNKYKLNWASVPDAFANTVDEAWPDACSNALALATPTWPDAGAEPLVAFINPCKSIVLYGSVRSPEINGERSGEPNTFLTLVKLPTSILVIAESKFSVVLGFSTSIKEGATCSISYPRTYALPGDTWTVNKLSDGTLPSSVVCVEE